MTKKAVRRPVAGIDKKERAIVVRVLKRASIEKGDPRFKAAVDAMLEHYPAVMKARSNKAKWTEKQFAFLWVTVQAKVRAFGQSVAATCAELGTIDRRILYRHTKMPSTSAVCVAYYRAAAYAKRDPATFREWDLKAVKLAATLKGRPKP
jgi:hypothetical protein